MALGHGDLFEGEADVGGAVGFGDGGGFGDEAIATHFDEVLVEGLHALVTGFFDAVFDFTHFAVVDELLDEALVQHDFHRAAAPARGVGHEALRQDGAQVERCACLPGKN